MNPRKRRQRVRMALGPDKVEEIVEPVVAEPIIAELVVAKTETVEPVEVVNEPIVSKPTEETTAIEAESEAKPVFIKKTTSNSRKNRKRSTSKRKSTNTKANTAS